MRRLKIALAAAVAFWFAAFAAIFLPELARTVAIDLGWSAVCLLAGVAALTQAHGDYRRAFVFLGAGAFAWGAGQLAWTWLDVVVGEVPYPSVADVGYTLSLPLLAIGLLSWPRDRGGFERGERLDGLLLSGAVGIVSVVVVIGPILERGFDGAAGWLLLAYPAGDVLVLGAAIFALSVHGFRDPGRMILVAVSLVVLGIADTGFALAGDDYVTGSFVLDPGWTLAFAGIGAAALLPAGWGPRLRLPRGLTPTAVLVVLAVAVAAQVVDEYRDGAHHDLITEALTGGLLLVLGFRHVHLSGARLNESLRLADLTGRLEHESALRTATLEASRTGFCLYLADGTVDYRNPAWLRLVGDEVEVPHGTGGVVTTAAGRVLAFASTRLPAGELVVSVDDVSEQERERATRDRFLAEVVRAQDLEARRIAELLHDDAVQRLTALGLRLELAAMRSGEPGLRELASEAGAITGSIRRLLVDLHPVILETQGIAAAVDGAAESLRAAGLDVDVEPLELRLVPEHEHLAYRMVQEALANVVAHAEASRIEVAFSVDGTTFRCRVDDDGRGFEPAAVERAVANGSLGLHLVRERIDLAGGWFAIGARKGGGTSFSFALPLRPREAPEEEAA